MWAAVEQIFDATSTLLSLPDLLLRILGEELWTFVALALLPLGTLALERASALKVSYLSEASIYPPEQAKTEEFVCTGMEPWVNIKVVFLSFVCQSQTLKSRCPVSSCRHQISGLSNLSVSLGRWLKQLVTEFRWYKNCFLWSSFSFYFKLIISLMPSCLDCAYWTRHCTYCSLQRCER